MKKDIKDKEKVALIEEKNSLERTLISLSEEVEFLSQKNEKFLKELHKKDFYEEYRSVNEELSQLQKSHVSLIDLIEGKEINIDHSLHPMTEGLLKKWRRENIMNASVGRMHSNSIGGNPMDVSYLMQNRPINGKYVDQNMTYDRMPENNNLAEKENHNELSTFSKFFNCGGVDNADSRYELSIAPQ
jgi:hypothetical protein